MPQQNEAHRRRTLFAVLVTLVETGTWAYAPASGQVTARNVSHNAAIAPSTSVEIGFQATHGGNTAKPASFTLNGAACTVA